jgi:four helix bundle protein
MPYKFEQLEVWKLALDYIDIIYKLAENLPRAEDYNLRSQITRATTSIALNIAEGSQGQSDAEQARFLGIAIRSLIETVACQQIIKRRNYLQDDALLRKVYEDSQVLAKIIIQLTIPSSRRYCCTRRRRFDLTNPMVHRQWSMVFN